MNACLNEHVCACACLRKRVEHVDAASKVCKKKKRKMDLLTL
jgi:hypothetical protein